MTHPTSPGGWLAAAERHPETPALAGLRTLDYRQLAAEAADLAVRLGSHGVRHGQVVAVQCPSAAQLAGLLYAALHLGFTLLPLDPGMAAARRERLLADVGGDFLVAERPPATAGIGWIAVHELFAESPAAAPVRANPPGGPPLRGEPLVGDPLVGDQVQLIIATSGTTGEPKGVMLSAANLAASVAASERRLGLGATDCWLACLPLFHIGGLSILLRCLAAGARVLLQEGFDAAGVWRQLAAGTVTHLSLVPAMLDRLLILADRPPPPTLRVVLIGGGPLSRSLAQRAHDAGWPLCVSYGMSETASQFATDCSPQAGLMPGLVGRPLDGYQVSIGSGGHIRVRGPAVMRGYADSLGTAGRGLDRGWFETGDLGRLDGQGRLTVIGRADDLLVSGGKNIHPAEVEERLLACPGVIGVGVAGRPHEVWGVTLAALYTGAATPSALAAWSRRHLPGHLRPREFLAVDELPLNAMGKLARPALRELLERYPPAGKA